MADMELAAQGRIIAPGGIIAPAPAPWYTYTPAITPFMSVPEGDDICGCPVPFSLQHSAAALTHVDSDAVITPCFLQ